MQKRASKEKGLALIITLLITALIVAVVTEIVHAVYIHTSFTSSYKDGQRAALLAEGGVELATSVITHMFKDKSYSLLRDKEARQTIQADDAVVSLRVEDELAKVSINSIVLPNGEINPENYATFLRLLKGIGLEDELADALSDWIDINDEPRPMGGETYDYYKRLSQPYSAKGGALDTLEEVLLVKGYSPQIYKRLSPFITVYAEEPGVMGIPKININTASKEVLMALSSDVTGDMAQMVIEYRDKNPFKDTADIRKVAGFETIGFSLQSRITVKSSIFRIFSKGMVGDGIREVEAVVAIKANKNLYWRER